MEPSLDLWIFAHRYDLQYLKQRCLASTRVQTAFLKTIIETSDIETFLRENVSFDGILEMNHAIAEKRGLHGKKELEKEYIARMTLQRLVNFIDERFQ